MGTARGRVLYATKSLSNLKCSKRGIGGSSPDLARLIEEERGVRLAGDHEGLRKEGTARVLRAHKVEGLLAFVNAAARAGPPVPTLRAPERPATPPPPSSCGFQPPSSTPHRNSWLLSVEGIATLAPSTPCRHPLPSPHDSAPIPLPLPYPLFPSAYLG